jgi:peptide deformylase
MARLPIIEFPDPRLRTVARPVREVDTRIRQLIDDMFETMYAAPGIGLAATQVDVHERLLVLDVSEDKSAPMVFINPEILESTGSQVYQEGCLSVPGIYADVKRADHVVVRRPGPRRPALRGQRRGLCSRCGIQAEMDHLAGKVFVDYLSPLKRELCAQKLAKQRRLEGNEDGRLMALPRWRCGSLSPARRNSRSPGLRAAAEHGEVLAGLPRNPIARPGGAQLQPSPVKQEAIARQLPVASQRLQGRGHARELAGVARRT